MNKVILFGVVLLLSGCASVFGGNKDDVSIHSDDPAAKILVNGNSIGTGDAIYQLPRGQTAIVTASKSGCEDRSISTQRDIDWHTWLDVVFWPTLVFDLATGNYHEASPTNYTVTPQCPANVAHK